jgi:hypothetical protein
MVVLGATITVGVAGRTSCLKKRRQVPSPAEKSGGVPCWFGLACPASGAADCAPLRDQNAG